MVRKGWIVVVCVSCLAMIGCGQGGRPEPKRFPVSGTVTFNGKPLATGYVYFKTTNTGAIDGIEIKDGRFTGKAEAGEKRVEVNSFDPPAPPPSATPAVIRPKNIIPPRYNSDSKLTEKVTPEGPNEYQFDLSSR
jgi:hypothetical protein